MKYKQKIKDTQFLWFVTLFLVQSNRSDQTSSRKVLHMQYCMRVGPVVIERRKTRKVVGSNVTYAEFLNRIAEW